MKEPSIPIRSFARAVFLVPLLLAAVACSSFELEGGGDYDLTPEAISRSETVHASFWGFLWSTPDVQKCEPGFQIYRVEYHDNFLFALASVATLGLYAPQSVEWWCVPSGSSGEDDEDDGDVWDPDADVAGEGR